MPNIDKLINGYKNFYQRYFIDNEEVYRKLSKGQSPIATIIACSDSRADPALVTGAEPGELFVIRNVANLVPPYQEDYAYHGTSAALEFAINVLKIKDVIVFGHSKCAGIRALVEDNYPHTDKSFVESWMKIAIDVKEAVVKENPKADSDHQAHVCEHKAIEKSLLNLLTFPWIKSKMENGELALHGWHFDIDHGKLSRFNSQKKTWEVVGEKDLLNKIKA